MTIKTVIGEIQKIEKSNFTTSSGHDLVKNRIHVKDENNKTVVVVKNTKPETDFDLPPGTGVTILFTTRQLGKGFINEIVKSPEALQIEGQTPVKPILMQVEKTTNWPTASTNPTKITTTNSNFDKSGQGQRQGMLFNNAVQVAIQQATSRGDQVVIKDIEQALLLLTELSNRQETNTLGHSNESKQSDVQATKSVSPKAKVDTKKAQTEEDTSPAWEEDSEDDVTF